MRIFNSFTEAYTPCEITDGVVNYNKCDSTTGYNTTGIAFNDAYRYVDWLLTVPLLLIEIVLVMKLSEAETFNRCVTLGVSSALMIANGYPGEITADPSTRWLFWALSMAPFCYIVYTLFVGIQVGYTFSDIISKCGVGYLVYRIGLHKSMIEKAGENGNYEAAAAEDEERAM